jgi:hypothetical protein
MIVHLAFPLQALSPRCEQAKCILRRLSVPHSRCLMALFLVAVPALLYVMGACLFFPLLSKFLRTTLMTLAWSEIRGRVVRWVCHERQMSQQQWGLASETRSSLFATSVAAKRAIHSYHDNSAITLNKFPPNPDFLRSYLSSNLANPSKTHATRLR